MSNLLDDIVAFCQAHNLSERQFGELSLNDKNFVPQLRDGRDLRMSTVERARAFMAEYRAAA